MSGVPQVGLRAAARFGTVCMLWAAAAGAAQPQPARDGDAPKAGPGAAPPVVQWSEFAPRGMGLRVELPGKPADLSGWLELPASKVYVRRWVLAENAPRRTITIMANTLKQAPDAAGANAALRNALDSMTAALQGKLEHVEDSAVGEFPGRAWRITAAGGGNLHGRIVLADRRLYQLLVETTAAELDESERRMLDSLRIEPGVELAEPPRTHDWRWVTPAGETYAVQLPDDPREGKERRATSLGEAETRTLTWTSADGKVRYEAAVLRLPRTPTAEEAAGLIDDVLREGVKSLGVEAADAANARAVEGGGKAWSLVAGERGRHMRAVVAGDRLYVVTADSAREPTADDRRFLESLKLPR